MIKSYYVSFSFSLQDLFKYWVSFTVLDISDVKHNQKVWICFS